MHRTSARPPPFDFALPHSSAYGIDWRKDISRSAYFEPSTRDGLQTPPADMSTTYQQAQYNDYSSRQDALFPLAGSSERGYASTYSGVNAQPRPCHPSVIQSSTVPNLRNDLHPSHRPSRASHPISSPPQHNESNILGLPEDIPRRKGVNSDMILPNLQIPSSINNSGGSLAEFAAQVIWQNWFTWKFVLTLE